MNFKEKLGNIFNKKFQPTKILFIRIGAIGDVVHTSMTYRAIKKVYPEAKIHYLTRDMIAPLINSDIELDKVWSVNLNDWRKNFNLIRSLAKELKAENFDLVVNMQPSFKTNLLIKMANIKRKSNYRKNQKLHAVVNMYETAERVIKELKPLPNLNLYLDDEANKKMQLELSQYKKPLIVISAGGFFAKRQGRTYPVEKWCELGEKIQKKYDGTIIITGLKEDEEILKPLKEIKNSVSYIDKLSLLDNSALINNVDLLLSGDSGPLHIATALNTKSIGVYGAMPIARTGPYGQDCVAIQSPKYCSPCNRRRCKYLKKSKEIYAPCMQEISTEIIFEKIKTIL
ncbi:MAG: glycosyltransferase family 9 protein [Candidatus Gastranaerophilales bacterium]